jgi:hypothetical protein
MRLPAPEGEATEGIVNGQYAPETGELTFFSKGRGIGDCGSAGAYAWTGDRFALTDYRTLEGCRGVGSEDWPVLWRNVRPTL